MKLQKLYTEGIDRQQLPKISELLNIPEDKLEEYVIKADPTPNQKFFRWILQQLRDGSVRFPEDVNQVYDDLVQYKSSRLDKDIFKYKSIGDLRRALETATGSKKKGYLQVDPMSLPGVEKISTWRSYILYRISDPDSLAEIGEGSSWCTRKSYKDNQAEHYIENHGHIFVVVGGGRLIAQFTPDFSQVMDVDDVEVEPLSKIALVIENLVNKEILSYNSAAANFAVNIKGKRVPELEDIIVKDLDSTLIYADQFIHGRWPEAEPYILKRPDVAFEYAKHRIKGRWPELERTIVDDPELATNYASEVIKGRWPEAEPYIMKDYVYAFLYARDILGRRWAEAEPYIMKRLKTAYYYARDVIEGRWPEAEPYIMKDSYHAFVYARDVIEGRWPEAEPYIMQDPYHAGQYRTYIKSLLRR